jgi:hypothetical protein
MCERTTTREQKAAMPRVYFDLTMSLDGFITGPDESVDRLHDWAFGGKTDADAEVREEI